MPTTPMSGNRCPEGQELWTGDNTCRTLYTFYYKARRVVAGEMKSAVIINNVHQMYRMQKTYSSETLEATEISGILSGSTNKDTVGIGTTTAVQSVCVC